MDAAEFAAKRHHVQISFENLVFAPFPLQRLRNHGLIQLLPQITACVALQVGFQQSRQLHG
jgi:hypothetical protein